MPKRPRTPVASSVRTSARVALWTSLVLTAATAWLLDRYSKPIPPESFHRIRYEQGLVEGVDFLKYPEVRLLRDYIAIDTSQPHPNEAAGAEFLAAQLSAAGIASHIERFADGHANLWAWIEGERPGALVLHGHLDVEQAIETQGWKYPPFEAVIEGPWIYGRGMYDMKSLTIAQLLAMIDVARSGRRPERSLLFLQTSNEEGGSDTGTQWILAEHPELVDRMEAVLTEGGVIEATNASDIKYWGIEFAQKRFVRATVCAPTRDELVAIARQIKTNNHGDPEPHVDPAVRTFLAAYGPSRDRGDLRLLLGEPDRLAREIDRFEQLTPFLQALFRNELWTGTPFQEPEAGWRMNIWVHVLPDDDPLQKARELLPPWKLRGLDASGLVVEDWGPPSPLDRPEPRELLKVVSERFPGVSNGPYFLPWAMTDARFFRERGIPAYGFSPFPVVVFDTVQIAHPNERMQLPAFRTGVALYSEAIQRLVE